MTARQRAFTLTVTRYAGVITRLCWYYSSSQSQFEDLRQDTLLNLWQGWDSFRGASAPQTWIYRVCLNTCVSSFRKSRRWPLSLDSSNLPDTPEPADPASEAREEIHSMLLQLPPPDRAIMLLWLEQHSYDEIAEIMGLPRNTVATRLRRAKIKLTSIAKSL